MGGGAYSPLSHARILAVLTAFLLAATACTSGGGSTPPRPPAWSKERMLRAMRRLADHPVGAPPKYLSARVGALFFNDRRGDHYCTAGVVDSPHHDLLVTAAHCLYGNGNYNKDIVFVPAFRAGATPFGTWTVTSSLVDDRWIKSGDQDMDVGFATVKPGDGKEGRNIQEVLGANKLGIDQGFDNVVEVTGYPINSDQPVSCITRTRKQSDHQLRFDCGNFFAGTSGAPWIADYDAHGKTGRIVGVIGGYEAGGETDSVSYSSYFDEGVQALYNRAVAQS
jgi:V8-like Glu-specific endopeptidase